MITVNEFVKDLEAVWDALNWDRKFENGNPESDPESYILHVFHAYSKEEVEQAKKILSTLTEEDGDDDENYIIRTAHLCSYSSGEAIVVTECRVND